MSQVLLRFSPLIGSNIVTLSVIVSRKGSFLPSPITRFWFCFMVTEPMEAVNARVSPLPPVSTIKRTPLAHTRPCISAIGLTFVARAREYMRCIVSTTRTPSSLSPSLSLRFSTLLL